MRKIGIVTLVLIAGYLSGRGVADAASSRLGVFDSISPSNGNSTTTFPQNVTISGALTATVPAASVSGVLSAVNMPNPSASTLGGIESYAAVSNQCINAISTSGVPSSVQLGFSNLSGTATDGQLATPYVKADATRPMTADWAFGGFGITGLTHLDSNTANRAGAGVLRLASTDAIDWRNNGNSANIALAKDTSDQLTYNGTAFLSSTPRLLAAAFPAMTGDVTNTAGAVATTISAAAVTLAKMANLAANSVIGNNTGSSATPTALTLASAATSSSVMYRDSNANTAANNFNAGYTTTATAAGTATLTNASTYYQYWTGSTTQTVKLPDATTLALGWTFMFVNNSSGNVTVQDNGGSSKQVMGAGSFAWFTCLSTGTAAGSWQVQYQSAAAGTVTSVALTMPGIFSISGSPVTTNGTLAVTASGTSGGIPYFSSSSALSSSAALTAHGVVIGGGAGTAPTSTAAGGTTTVLAGAGASADPTYQDLRGNSTLLKAPTVQKFTSSTGTYTTPTSPSPLYIKVTMVGGGGGGGGNGTSGQASGGAGGNTTFGTTLLVANGGSGGASGGTAGGGNSAAGGTASLGTAVGLALTGGSGQGGSNQVGTIQAGGAGASSALGGGGGGGWGSTNAGSAGATNSGGGGGGAGATTSFSSGSGGGAGGFVSAIITAPSASYSYAVGAAGTAGGAGTSGAAGGAGGSGVIVVEEFYQ